MDLSRFSDADLEAIAAGDMTRVSDMGLRFLSGEKAPEIKEPLKIGREGFADSLRSVLDEAGWGQRNIAAAGTAVSNVIQGTKQFAGKADPVQMEADRIMRQEAPVGAFAGDVGMTALPFGLAGKSVKAAATVGGVYGALQPVEGEQTFANIAKGKAINTAVGGASAAGGQVLANKVSGYVAKKAGEQATKKAQNAVTDKALTESIQEGYRVPPSLMPDSGVSARVAEGLSGKDKAGQLAMVRNQQVTNRLARKALGLPDSAPLSSETTQAVRESAYAPYKELALLPVKQRVRSDPLMNVKGSAEINPAAMLEDLKTTRADASAWYKAYNRSAHPDDLAKAKAFEAAATKLDAKLEAYAASVGRPELLAQMREARKLISKTYTIERALNGSNVDAVVIGKLFKKNKPLSDGLDTIGRFAANFGDVSRVPKSGYSNPFTVFDAGYSGVAGMLLNPYAAALPVGRVATRYGLLSGGAQRAIANPEYALPLTTRAAGGLLSNAPIGGTVLSLDALGQ